MNFEQGLEIMASIVFYMYLIWVSRQDLKEMQVVRYSHILGVAAIFLQIVPKALQSDSRIYEAREYWVAVMVLLFLQMGACFLGILFAGAFFDAGHCGWIVIDGSIGERKCERDPFKASGTIYSLFKRCFYLDKHGTLAIHLY